MNLSIDLIDDFPNHPFKVKDDDSMMELVESIKDKGLINPVLVRPIENGRYEMISGHRRKRACELAGIKTIDSKVMDCSRDEATLLMVDSNLQREEILPSEKAFSYKLRLDAMKRTAGRPSKDNLVPVGLNSSRNELSTQTGESQTQIQRYIRLTELIPQLLDMVDEKRIAMRPAVELSYLQPKEQLWLVDAIELADATPSHVQAIKLRKLSSEGNLDRDMVEDIMLQEKPNQKEKPQFRDKRIVGLIPKGIPLERQADYVCAALEHYNRFLKKRREQVR